MQHLEHRLKFLEQKTEVMQKEVSEVLSEMSSTIQKIAATYGIAMRTLDDRMSEIERRLNISLKVEATPADKDSKGSDN
jgi:uncharacterized coiled-coil protein SlyX